MANRSCLKDFASADRKTSLNGSRRGSEIFTNVFAVVWWPIYTHQYDYYFSMKDHSCESWPQSLIMHKALHALPSCKISRNIQKNLSCAPPHPMILMRMWDTTTLLCGAAFIGGSFMSVKICFLLNLSSFTQGRRHHCINTPWLFKTLAGPFAFDNDFWHDPKYHITWFKFDWCKF